MTRPKNVPVALVTGAAKRIGCAMAIDLAKRGWAVALHYHTSEKDALKTLKTIHRHGGQGIALHADLASPAAASSLITTACDRLGTVTCLINNASLFENDTIETMTAHSLNKHMQINLQAPLFLIQRFVSLLRNTQDTSSEACPGNIINIIDQRVHNPRPPFLSYTLSKSTLWTLTPLLARALAPHIRVNAIAPGPTLQSIHQTPERFAQQCRQTLLQRPVHPDEINRALSFILETKSLTGQTITLDSGQHLQ